MTDTMVTLRAPEVRTMSAIGLRFALGQQLSEVQAASRFAPGVQLRDVQADGRFLLGRAVPYNTWTSIGWFAEQFAPGAFARSIKEAANGLPLLVWHDNRTWPIGVADSWDDNADGLDGVWKLDNSEEALRAADLAEKKMLTGLSVGFVPIRSTWEMVDYENWDPDLGIEHMDKVTRDEARLIETSVTPTPAYAGAQVQMVRSREAKKVREHQSRELEAWRSYLESVKR